jgi:hypothetical protein
MHHPTVVPGRIQTVAAVAETLVVEIDHIDFFVTCLSLLAARPHGTTPQASSIRAVPSTRSDSHGRSLCS